MQGYDRIRSLKNQGIDRRDRYPRETIWAGETQTLPPQWRPTETLRVHSQTCYQTLKLSCCPATLTYEIRRNWLLLQGHPSRLESLWGFTVLYFPQEITRNSRYETDRHAWSGYQKRVWIGPAGSCPDTNHVVEGSKWQSEEQRVWIGWVGTEKWWGSDKR